jgi:hypothetical protein
MPIVHQFKVCGKCNKASLRVFFAKIVEKLSDGTILDIIRDKKGKFRGCAFGTANSCNPLLWMTVLTARMKGVSRADTYYPYSEPTFDLLPFLPSDELRNFHRIAHERVSACMMHSTFDGRFKLNKINSESCPFCE